MTVVVSCMSSQCCGLSEGVLCFNQPYSDTLSELLPDAEVDPHGILFQLCSIAAARLHTLLQTRPVEKLQESCFVMATVDKILVNSLNGVSQYEPAIKGLPH